MRRLCGILPRVLTAFASFMGEIVAAVRDVVKISVSSVINKDRLWQPTLFAHVFTTIDFVFAISPLLA